MGKGTITGGGDDGKYSIKLDFGKAARDAQMQRISKQLASLGPEIATAQSKYDAEKTKENSKRQAATLAITAYTTASNAVPRVPANVAAALKTYTAAAGELNIQQGKTAQANAALEILKIQQAQLQKDDAKWRNMELEATREVWCADLTEDATGEVATIEIPGESKHFLIAPEGKKPTESDGLVIAREVQSAAQVFFNAAILPGWQKFRPTYRAATITAVDYAKDTADVTLSTDDVSSAQKLGINQTDTLEKVPVEYMTCNAAAFDIGDTCVIKFEEQDWTKPKLIGFFDNPRPCGSGIGVAYEGAEGMQYAVLTPSGTYRQPTGDWRMKTEKGLTGGDFPWSGTQIGEYAVSDGVSGNGLKYSGVAVANKRATAVTLTFGGEVGGKPFVAQIYNNAKSGFSLSLVESPKRLRTLRAFKPAEKNKAFAIDIPPQYFANLMVADVSSDGLRILAVKQEGEQSAPAITAPVGYAKNEEARIVTIALPIPSDQEYMLDTPEVFTEIPAGRPDYPDDDGYNASTSRYAVYLEATRTSGSLTGNTQKTWTRRLDMEFPSPIHFTETATGLYFRPDGGIEQEKLRLVQSRDDTFSRVGAQSHEDLHEVPGSTLTISGRSTHNVKERLTCNIGGSVFEIADIDITDSGEWDLDQVWTDGSYQWYANSSKKWKVEGDITTREIQFFDRQFKVLVYLEFQSVTRYTKGWTNSGYTYELGPVTETPREREEDNECRIVVWQAGAEIYEKAFDGKVVPNHISTGPDGEDLYFYGYNEDDGFMSGETSYTQTTQYLGPLANLFDYRPEGSEDLDFEIKSAKDPMTGALVLHLNIKNDGWGGAEAKWFVFDGAGVVKNISDISDIPPAAIPTVLISV